MGNKTRYDGVQANPIRNIDRNEVDTQAYAENNADNLGNWGSVALTPLGTRFFDTQADLSSSRQRLLRQIIDESN